MKKGEERRGQILDAAEKLFYERGYDRVSVQDVLDALNMSKGGFYHYFDSKQALLRQISDRRARARFDRLAAELGGGRVGPVERLNALLGMANLFEAEEAPFAAMMVKLCYVEGDMAMRAQRRRNLVDRLTPLVDAAIAEGLQDGSLSTRHPAQVGRLLVLLACDVDDEACQLLADNPDSPDVMLRLLELLNAWRDSAELLSGAPYGALTLFDAPRLISAWRTAMAIIEGQAEGDSE